MEIEVKSSPEVDKTEEPKVAEQVETPESDGVETSPIEQKALDRGWRPKEEWTGDPEQWRSAKEFMDRGELLDKISSQSRELKQITAIVSQLSEQNRQVYKAGYQKALNELRGFKAKAVTDQDGAAVVKIDDAIDATKEAIRKIDDAPSPTQAVQETDAFIRFKENNSWYNESEAMRHWAHGMGLTFANRNPQVSEEKVYEFIEKEYRKEFPHKVRGQRELPSSPEGGSRRSEGGKGAPSGKAAFDKLLAGMPEDQARVAKDMVRRGIVTAEKYVEDYNAVVVGR